MYVCYDSCTAIRASHNGISIIIIHIELVPDSKKEIQNIEKIIKGFTDSTTTDDEKIL